MRENKRPHEHRITLRVTEEMWLALQCVPELSTYTMNGFLRTAIIEQLRDFDNKLGLGVQSAEWNDDRLGYVQQRIADLRHEQWVEAQKDAGIPF